MLYRGKRRKVYVNTKLNQRLGAQSRFRARLARARGAPSVYKFKEPYIGQITAAPLIGTPGVITGSVSNLSNWSSYRQLFDLYRIVGMKVTFVPRWNVAQPSLQDLSSGTAGVYQPGGLPVLYIAPNRDGQVPAPTGLADIINDDGVKVRRLDKKCSFYISSPKALIEDGNSTLVPFLFNNKMQPWLSTGGSGQAIDQSGLKHFGFRYLIDNLACANSISVDTYTTLYFQMKERD